MFFWLTSSGGLGANRNVSGKLGMLLMCRYSHTSSGAKRLKCDVVLKKLKEYFQKRRPVTGFQNVCLLHDNVQAQTYIWNCKAISKVRKRAKIRNRYNQAPHLPTHIVLSRFSPLPVFLTFSKTKNVLIWPAIYLQTSTWLSRQPVHQRYTKNSRAWHILEVDSRTDVMYFRPRRIFERM